MEKLSKYLGGLTIWIKREDAIGLSPCGLLRLAGFSHAAIQLMWLTAFPVACLKQLFDPVFAALTRE